MKRSSTFAAVAAVFAITFAGCATGNPFARNAEQPVAAWNAPNISVNEAMNDPVQHPYAGQTRSAPRMNMFGSCRT